MAKETKKNNLVKSIFGNLGKALTAVFSWLGSIKMPIVVKVLAFVLALASSFVIFVEFVLVFLIAADPEQFAIIMQAITGFSPFIYLSFRDFYLMLFGGFVMDITFFTLLLWFALWWGWRRDFLIRDWFKAMAIFFFGALFFLAGFYYALPGLIKLDNQKLHSHEKRAGIVLPYDDWDDYDRHDDDWDYKYDQHEKYYEIEVLPAAVSELKTLEASVSAPAVELINQ